MGLFDLLFYQRPGSHAMCVAKALHFLNLLNNLNVHRF